ncbi:hypothetical protein EON81_14415 [bacterium]|nr:MAG: hypothetical protein EON81_14415 [bacterium]
MSYTVDAIVAEDGKVHVSVPDLRPGESVELKITRKPKNSAREDRGQPGSGKKEEFVWPPEGPNSNHPFWGLPYEFKDPIRPLDLEDWGSLA